MISTQVSRASSTFLGLCGLGLLFASDMILPRLVPSFPASGAWVGQLLAAALLAVAALNWLSRSMLLGGIYGRAVVASNATLYFIAAMVLLRAIGRGGAIITALWLLFVPTVVLAAIYGWLLFRGPFDRDFQLYRGGPDSPRNGKTP